MWKCDMKVWCESMVWQTWHAEYFLMAHSIDFMRLVCTSKCAAHFLTLSLPPENNFYRSGHSDCPPFTCFAHYTSHPSNLLSDWLHTWALSGSIPVYQRSPSITLIEFGYLILVQRSYSVQTPSYVFCRHTTRNVMIRHSTVPLQHRYHPSFHCKSHRLVLREGGMTFLYSWWAGPCGLARSSHQPVGSFSSQHFSLSYINYTQCTCHLSFYSSSACLSLTLHHSSVSSMHHIPLCVSFYCDCFLIFVHHELPGPCKSRRPHLWGPFVIVTSSSTWMAHKSWESMLSSTCFKNFQVSGAALGWIPYAPCITADLTSWFMEQAWFPSCRSFT